MSGADHAFDYEVKVGEWQDVAHAYLEGETTLHVHFAWDGRNGEVGKRPPRDLCAVFQRSPAEGTIGYQLLELGGRIERGQVAGVVGGDPYRVDRAVLVSVVVVGEQLEEAGELRGLRPTRSGPLPYRPVPSVMWLQRLDACSNAKTQRRDLGALAVLPVGRVAGYREVDSRLILGRERRSETQDCELIGEMIEGAPSVVDAVAQDVGQVVTERREIPDPKDIRRRLSVRVTGKSWVASVNVSVDGLLEIREMALGAPQLPPDRIDGCSVHLLPPEDHGGQGETSESLRARGGAA